MNKAFSRALFLSALCVGSSFSQAAEDQPTVSADDLAVMHQQQKALEEFKKSLQGQTIQLPKTQQNLVEQLQQGIRTEMDQGRESGEKTPRAVYFVSLSIPSEGLLPMLVDARRMGIPATIRGLVDNDMRKTASALFELSKQDKNVGVQVDPTLFQQYGIQSVPSLVVTCPGHFDVIRGSLPLQQALEKIAEKGDCAVTARDILGSKS